MEWWMLLRNNTTAGIEGRKNYGTVQYLFYYCTVLYMYYLYSKFKISEGYILDTGTVVQIIFNVGFKCFYTRVQQENNKMMPRLLPYTIRDETYGGYTLHARPST